MAPKSDMARLHDKIDDIDEKVDGLSLQMAAIVSPGEAADCAVHEQRIKSTESRLKVVEGQQTKQNLLAMTISAATAGIIVLGKWMIGTK